MARLTEYFSFGNKEEISMSELLVLLDRMYTNIAVAVNQKPDLYQRNTNGLTTDTNLSQGSLNINLSTNKVEMLTNHDTSSSVTWTTLS